MSSRRPQDDPLRRALAELPPTAAPPGFSARVMARIERRRRRRAAAGALAAVAAAALLAVGLTLWAPDGAPGGGGTARSAPAEDPAVEVASDERLRAATRDLRRELEALQALRTLADERAPLLYVGGDEQVDLVIDLGPWAEELAARDVRPAARRGHTP